MDRGKLLRPWLIYARRALRFIRVFIMPVRFSGLAMNYLYYKGKKQKVFSKPSFLQIEPTNLCNLSCVLCSQGNGLMLRSRGRMEIGLFKKIVDEHCKHVAFIVLYNIGESFLNESIFEMIDYASSKKIYVKISTNGLFINKDIAGRISESKLDELLISLDFSDRQSYAEFKGKDVFNEVLENIRILVNKRGRKLNPFLVLQFLMIRDNQDKVTGFLKLARELKIDQAVIKKVRINDYGGPGRSDLLPKDKRYLRDLYLDHRNTPPVLCLRPWFSATILWDGAVVPCCFDANGQHVFGNIRRSSLGSIWNCPSLTEFRRAASAQPSQISLCAECSCQDILGNFAYRQEILR